MNEYSIPSLRFSVINPNDGLQIAAKYPYSAFAGTPGFRVEFVWEPFRQPQYTKPAAAAPPVNSWVTEEIALNQGLLWVRLGNYATTTSIGAPQLNW